MRNVKREDAGRVLADTLRSILYDLEVEDGLSVIGYSKEDIPDLVKGTIPQVCSSLPYSIQDDTVFQCLLMFDDDVTC